MIRVLIERLVLPGMEEQLLEQLRAMRRDAVHASGYISGETLHDVIDARHYVIISTWLSRADWDAWAGCAARQQVISQIAPMLAAPEKISLLEPI
jgi:heme-degrading monooxygenase HmoA